MKRSICVLSLLLMSSCGVSGGPSLLQQASEALKPTDGTVTVSGDEHGCALFASGDVKCWGGSQYGQLGQGDMASRGDEPGEMGAALPFIDLGTGVKAKLIDAGRDYTCALTTDNRLKCWGRNQYGQLGAINGSNYGDQPNTMGDNLPFVDFGASRTVSKMSIGANHACVILDDQSIKCWGRNQYGQLGYGDTNSRGDTAGEMGDNLPTVDLGSGFIAASIYAYREHTCALSTVGTVKCWGNNDSGQLGLEDTVRRGDGAGEMGTALPTVDLGAGRTVKKIGSGIMHSCALLDNSTVKCWGDGARGNLGYEDANNRGDSIGEMGDNLPAVDLGGGRTVSDLFVGRDTNCAILDNKALKCWGRNDDGQLGLGDTIDHGSSVGQMGDSLLQVELGSGVSALQVDMGSYQVCALLSNRKFKCWGLNDYGQLGLGDDSTRGDDPGEMGDALPFLELF